MINKGLIKNNKTFSFIQNVSSFNKLNYELYYTKYGIVHNYLLIIIMTYFPTSRVHVYDISE